MRALGLALSLIAAPAAAADQFDLLCKAPKASAHYRIDLAQSEYCFGDCKNIMRIQEVTSGMIVLYDDKPSPPNNETAYNRINRLTGEWQWYDFDPRSSSIMDHRGSCALADFTGFGVSSRKF